MSNTTGQSGSMSPLKLTVIAAAEETAAIRRIVLAGRDSMHLPAFTPGAHITINLPEIGARKYSLIETSGRCVSPSTYTLAVRLEAAGGGGSLALHKTRVGDVLDVDPPQNNFALSAGNMPVALIAGGIGVTPLISMAASMKSEGREFRMYYAARSAEDLAFRPILEALVGPNLSIHLDSVTGRLFDMHACFTSLGSDTQVYMCGPKPMLKAGMAAARQLGWPRDRLKFELFYSVAGGNGAA